MCHDDLELHLARQTPGGPVVEVLPLAWSPSLGQLVKASDMLDTTY